MLGIASNLTCEGALKDVSRSCGIGGGDHLTNTDDRVVGSGCRVPIGNGQFQFDDDFTIAFWVDVIDGQRNLDGSGYQYFAGISGDFQCNIFTAGGGSMSLHFGVNGGGAGNETNAFAASALSAGDNGWLHFVVTVTKGSGATDDATIVWYKNGSALTTTRSSELHKQRQDTFTTALVTSAVEPWFGWGGIAASADSIVSYKGSMAECAVWNKALSAASIAEIYGFGQDPAGADLTTASGNYASGDVSALTGYWKMDNGNGRTACDTSGFSPGPNDGELLGNAAFA